MNGYKYRADTTPKAIVEMLSKWESRWTTDLGAWFPGDQVLLRGKNIFEDWADSRWMGYLLFAITGRQFSDLQVQMFEGIWILSTSFPDPRLWNNRMAALAATARSTSNLGLAAGIAVSEAIIFGHRPLLASFNFLTNIQRQLIQGANLETMLRDALAAPVTGRPGSGRNRQVARVPGFGRPITSRDERLEPLLGLAERLGFRQGPHLLLTETIERTLGAMGQPLKMNVATLMGALCADQSMTAKQYYHYAMLCFTAGIVPCALDASEHPEGAFFPLRCSNIQYEGKPLRKWRSQL